MSENLEIEPMCRVHHICKFFHFLYRLHRLSAENYKTSVDPLLPGRPNRRGGLIQRTITAEFDQTAKVKIAGRSEGQVSHARANFHMKTGNISSKLSPAISLQIIWFPPKVRGTMRPLSVMVGMHQPNLHKSYK